jgi:protein SCO1/2
MPARTRIVRLARQSLFIALVLAAAPVMHRALAQDPDPARAARLMDDLMWSRGTVGGPFALVDQLGNKRTDADFRGKLLLVYFGYTYCPDVCPTDLQQIALAVDKLGAAADEVQPIFISLDPERDTTNVLASYVAFFHPRLIGLTGTAAQIRAVADEYKAYYARHSPPGGGEYLIDHSGFIYLMGRSGEYLGFFPPGTPAERMAEIIGRHLAP